MLGIIKALTDVGNYVKELKTYYSLKNQMLYSSTSEWNSGSKTVANITKYQTIKVYPWDGYDGITLERVGSKFQGTGFVTNVSSGSHTSLAFILNVTQRDVVTIGVCSLLHHTKNTSHSTLQNGWIKKIVGIDPIIPQTLTKLGGGIDTVRGWLYAISKAMFEGYCKLCGYVNRCAARLSQSWKLVDTVGEHVIKNDSHYGNKKYNISNSIQCKANSDWPMYRFNSIPGLVQYYRVQHTKHVFYYGIQKQLQYLLHISRSLDCHRQSIAPRGCCHV